LDETLAPLTDYIDCGIKEVIEMKEFLGLMAGIALMAWLIVQGFTAVLQPLLDALKGLH
jgi:hypothetical protein